MPTIRTYRGRCIEGLDPLALPIEVLDGRSF
jgi:hypothetical protein